MLKASKLLMLKASELHFATPSAWSWPWRWYHKIPIMSIQRASILTRYPKIHANSFKTVDVMASTLHISTPPWAWRWPWGLYHKIPIMSFQRASMLNKMPITHVKSFETVQARPSGLHFPTPFWAWGRPRSLNQEFDLTRFFTYVLLMTYPKINSLGYLVSEK